MARKVKRTARKRIQPAMPPAPGVAAPAPGMAAPRSRKNLLGLVVLLVFVLLAIEGVFILKQKMVSNLVVQPVVRFSGDEKESGTFGSWDVTAVDKDKMAFTDQGKGSVLIFDLTGNFIKRIGKGGKEKDLEFNEPSGITTDDKGNVYVMDAWNCIIKGLTVEGDLVLKIDLGPYHNFYGPRGLAWDGSNFIVADTGTHRIVKISPSGVVLSSWGRRGTGKGEFQNPLGVVVDKSGNIYVADSDNRRVQVLNSKGEPQRVIDVGGVPSDVALDSYGRLFVSSREGGFVKAFNPKGKNLGTLVDPAGSGDVFKQIIGIGITPDNVLLCAGSNTIAGWRLPPP